MQATQQSRDNAISVQAAIKLLVVATCHGQHERYNQSALLDTAWKLLLDFDTERLQALPDAADRREDLNQSAIAKACKQLCSGHRTLDAEELQQHVQLWLRSSHYVAKQDAATSPCPPASTASKVASTSSTSSSGSSTGSHGTGFCLMPMTEHQAVLSLLLALSSSSPPAAPVLTSLPPLGASMLQRLKQEAYVAAAAQLEGQGSSNCWVPMSPDIEQLLLGASGLSATPPAGQSGDTARPSSLACAAVAGVANSRSPATSQPLGSGSWLSPAAAAMELLQQVPLNAAAAEGCSYYSLQSRQPQPPDDITLAAVCGDGSTNAASTTIAHVQLPQPAAPLPLLEQLAPQMQLAVSSCLLGQPLVTTQQPAVPASTEAVAGLSATANSSSSRPGRCVTTQHSCDNHSTGCATAGNAWQGSISSPALSAAAAGAAEAVRAAAAIRPAAGALLQLCSAPPGSGLSRLVREEQLQDEHDNNTGTSTAHTDASSKPEDLLKVMPYKGMDSSSALKDTAAELRDQQAPAHTGAVAPGSSSSRQSLLDQEAELVSLACLALQGGWSAVRQLWQQVLMGKKGATWGSQASRLLGLSRPSVQQQLLVQVLHAAELRLRVRAFLQHFQTASSAGSTATADSSSSSSSMQEHTMVLPIQTAFLSAVQAVLAEQDAALAKTQQCKLQVQQEGPPVTLLQLLVVHRRLIRQLQQLAEVCCCTIEQFLENRMFVKTIFSSSCPSRDAPPAGISSSSMLNWAVLQRMQRTRQAAGSAAAAAAALQAAAAAAYEGSLLWPSAAEDAAARQLGWAPSSWQLRQGFDSGYVLLDRLLTATLQASPDAAPLLRHLFSAAVQPVLLALHAWAFRPDTAATEAAAEATAMTSISVGASVFPGSSRTTLAALCSPTGSGSDLHPHAAAAAATAGTVATHKGAAGRISTGGVAAAAVKPWQGSRAADGAVRACLQQAWGSICSREPCCPAFLKHAQQAARVAGLQLHLLQLLGATGQRLADRLGWLAELEQAELQEVLSANKAADGSSAGQDSRDAGKERLVAAGAAAGVFMGLLCSRSSGFRPGTAVCWAPASGPACTLTAQQLEQCAAIAADYEAARHAQVQLVLQGLAAEQAAGKQAHEVWLACRQEAKHVAEEARRQLEAEAAARRQQRQQLLLDAQRQEAAAARARRHGERLAELALDRNMLQQAALADHEQALQQLQVELTRLDDNHAQTAAAAAAAQNQFYAGSALAAAPAVPQQHQEPMHQGFVSGFAAAARAAAFDEGAVDVSSIVLDGLETDEGASTRAAPDAVLQLQDAAAAAPLHPQPMDVLQQQQQPHPQQQNSQRATWGRPLQDIAPAAGAPSGQADAAPLAVIGSAAAQQAAAGAAAAVVQAAGRRSNSQPKVLPGMGRPVSLSRRNSSSGDAGGSDSAAAAAAPAAGHAAHRTGRGSGVSAVGSILDGFGAMLPFAAAGRAQLGQPAKGKWGVPVVPAPAAGVASTLQRRASTGMLSTLDGVDADGAQEQRLRQQQLQRRPSGGLSYGSSRAGGLGSRPRTPRQSCGAGEQPFSAGGMGGLSGQQQQHMQRQQSWHYMQQQQQEQLLQKALEAALSNDAVGQGGQMAVAGMPTTDGRTAAAAAAQSAASTIWLLSRKQQRPENQGNTLLLDYLLQSSGCCDCVNHTGTGLTPAGLDTQLGPCNHAAGAVAEQHSSSSPAHGEAASSSTGSSTAAPAEPAPLMAVLEVLAVQPLLAQQRLTTLACWSLLLQEHRLLQRLSAVQGLFFQQHGDWVELLCDALEPLLLTQQQQQQQQQRQAQPLGAANFASAAGGGQLSPVVLQLLLESSVQQSCLVGCPEVELLDLQVSTGRALAGWTNSGMHNSSGGGGSDSTHHQALASTATDCLVLTYDPPWPLSLLLSPPLLSAYADVFSVLLRLRRLHQQLVQQRQRLNHRTGGSSRGMRQRNRPRHASEQGWRNTACSSSSSEDARRATWHGAVAAPGVQREPSGPGGHGAATPGPAAAAAAGLGLVRLQQVRRWHSLALHFVQSVLGFMLGELSGPLQGGFEAAVGSQAVSLLAMLEAHERLLLEAQQACLLLPAGQHGQQRQQVQGSDASVRGLVCATVEAAWQLQQRLVGLLCASPCPAARDPQQGSSSSSSSGGGLDTAAAGTLLRLEGTQGTALALALADDTAGCWEALEGAGEQFERLLEGLQRRLKASTAAAAGHHLAGLASRLC